MRKLPLLFLLAATSSAFAQTAPMSFEEYDPKSTLVVPEHPRTKAKYPFIDVHNHQRREMTAADVDKLIADMDRIGLSVMVNLSGGSGDAFRQGLNTLRERYPKRFVAFANIDFAGIDEPDFATKAAAQLEQDVKNDAVGLKIFKNLGMFLNDKSGKRVPTDDPRLDPIWKKAGELKIPVLIHTGEPMAFWSPLDKHNERWLELQQYPNRRRDDPKFASFEQTMSEQFNLFRRHPKTTFIAAHLAWLGNDLARLGKLLDEMPNVYTEMGAVLYELGRQPRAARAFLIKYQDRVLMGKDIWNADEYATYFRVLETEDEYFDYYRKRHAFWKMYGLGLPDEVLKKVYYKNALRLMPAIDRTAFPD
ncbi:MAG TPA: amidohydrolase family protein [Thermoanaerobaculia bacterium]|jgi:predicted TIM-barrel fold metal-dependent hydrolase|nr:amidohydrolase family protein [Thermoanaerobaculia bacterium]